MKTLLLLFVLTIVGALQSVSDAVRSKPTPTAVNHATTTSQSAVIAASATPPQETKKEIVKEKSSAKESPTPMAPPESPSPTPPAPIQPAPAQPTTPKQATELVSDLASLVEQEVLAQTNVERVKNGLSPLSYEAKLAQIARAHSVDMLTNDYFNHEDQNGCSSSCRVSGAGYTWSTVGENIYMMSGYNLTAMQAAEMIVQGWMKSPGHRANILRGTYSETGVGIALEGDTIYATADYAKPR